MKEKPKDRFSRLAVKRVNNALKCIQLIGNLSTKPTYDYSPADVNKIFDALTEEIRKSKARFSSKSGKTKFEL